MVSSFSEAIMNQTVKGRHGRGQLALGQDITCPVSEHNGWGTGCQLLVIKDDGLYHCGDCGLVYDKPERYEKLEKTRPTAQCECANLKEEIEWWFDECNGHDCPSRYYQCTNCGRHYKRPSLASLEKQESEGGKKEVQSWIDFRRREHSEKLSRIQDDVQSLVEALKEATPKERRELLKPLFS